MLMVRVIFCHKNQPLPPCWGRQRKAVHHKNHIATRKPSRCIINRFNIISYDCIINKDGYIPFVDMDTNTYN